MYRTSIGRTIARPMLGNLNRTCAARFTSYAASRVFPRQGTLALATQQKPMRALVRWASGSRAPMDTIDAKREDKVAHKTLKQHPELVTTESSVHNVFHEEGVAEQEKEIDMLAGVKSDLRTIRDTFSLEEVPREALYVGLAGVLPYLATSVTTVYLAWDIQHAARTGSGFLLDGNTAELLLHVVEPLQVGYGAVILSFLGAIHWGLEWAKFGGTFGYRRYAPGIIATAVAWPTILLPVEYALICQFLAFNFMYFQDARASVRGWAPSWYGTYRFVLTFIVGASIVASLIGRGQISDMVGKPSGPADRLRALRENQLANLEKEEIERRDAIVEDEEEEDEE